MLDYISQLELLWPYALLLAFAPLLLQIRKDRNSDNDSVSNAPYIHAYVNAHSEYGFTQSQTGKLHKRKKSILILLWLLLVIALSRPQLLGPAVELPLEGRDLMLAIDISPSMKEEDMPLDGYRATRLDVVKSVVGEFTSKRQGDRLGLILFGTEPYIQSPLSFDTKTINTLLQEAFLGMAGQATAIGDAIGLAVKRLKDRPEQSRVLILLTDGANTAGEIPPEKAAELAGSLGIKIYTVGIGADEMLQRSLFGTRRVNPSADLDEDLLKQVAATTNGEYFRARNVEELKEIYTLIDQLEPIESDVRIFQPKQAISHYFLALALLIFSVYKLVVLLQRASRQSSMREEQDA
ncbi:hypothetical protein A3762_15950 [Oleiphilus sp. HI0125]|uniref:vWA domain-containing protein n=1 Tax=Oleiphilus sp. HI0125 TaxID=1822266 RepID=UPI0007C40252|nr:VWA domain-containing protein [Oleiphilus sp. HI0125]KZZ59953.1 hypothetical protein A3762_15950 [Oleiphilus sp. HI0125]